MSSGPMHQYQVDLAVELAEPQVSDFIRRNMEYARLGSGWHDFSLPPEGLTSRKRAREYWVGRGVAFADNLVQWGLADEMPFVRRHFIYAPDWYLRRMHQAMQEGNEPKVAVVWGILLHSCEYLTASKGSSMIVHGLPDDLAWAERWLVNGHPFQDEFAYEARPREFDHAKVVSSLRPKLSRPTQDVCCSELYLQMVQEHYFGFFPAELQWLLDFEEHGAEQVVERYEDLCYQELAGTLNIGVAALRDVLSGRMNEPKGADILFLIREDLWRRQALEGKTEAPRPVIEGLRYISSACRLGLSFDLRSGEGLPDLGQYSAVVALCGEGLRDEEEFRRAIQGHDHVVVVNHDADDERGFELFFAELRGVLGPNRVPEDAHMTRPEIVSAFRRLAELRRPRAAQVVSCDVPEGDARTVIDLSELSGQDELSCVMWNGKEHPKPDGFIKVDPALRRWTIHAPVHGTLHLRKAVALPQSERILLRLSFYLEERIAVGMRIECVSDEKQVELLRMHVTDKEPQICAFDLTRLAGRQIELRFAWNPGYDFGYEDKDILIVERPEILSLM